jgi:hypothetical protein
LLIIDGCAARKSSLPSTHNVEIDGGEISMQMNGAVDAMTLLSETDDTSGRELRVLRLEASIDGRTVVMTELDHRVRLLS